MQRLASKLEKSRPLHSAGAAALFAMAAIGLAMPMRARAEDEAGAQLARQAVQLLDKYCQRCHGVEFRYPGLDVANRDTLVRPKDPQEEPYLVPGKPEDSRIWDALDTGSMPPEGQPQPSAAERDTIRRWIAAGAAFPEIDDRPPREFLGERTLLSMIAADLLDRSEQEAADTRYLSLAHLWNDTKGKDPTTDQDLREVRAAVSKLINSLSSKPEITRPRRVDPQGTLLAIRLSDFGWTDWHWNRLLQAYPYGLRIAGDEAARVYRLTSKIPYVRADWFIFQAARPPLYHDLLGLPQNARTLEDDLGVDIRRNFQRGELKRAAFQVSGVSRQNRMVERHAPRKGGRYYWKSYDIQPNTGERGDFTRRPLGPEFEDDGQPGRQLATFAHDGGEIIYSLPNGLQAYLLVDGKDRRIDVGPLAVVSDANQHSGTFEVVNGVSCMGCHRRGMISWEKEDVRPLYENRNGRVAEKVLQLFPPVDAMRDVVAADARHFLDALELATGPLLRTGENDSRDLREFAEPVTKVSNRYQRNVSLDDAARELGLPDTREQAEPLGLKSREDLQVLAGTQLFADLGLGNFANRGVVVRSTWEQAMGRVARELRIGIPWSVR